MVKSAVGQGYGLKNGGRKKAILKALMRVYYQRGNVGLTCGELARKMGLKSSTYLKHVCAEMEIESEQVEVFQNAGIWRVRWYPFEQTPLPERFITINGKSCRVADWVGVK